MVARRIIGSHGVPTAWLSAKAVLRLVPAIVLTQVVYYTLAVFGAQFARNVAWRGVRYHIHGSWDIRRIDDPQYDSESPRDADGHSL